MSAGVTTGPKCRPVQFSGPMVLAILAGRKTMTRRVVKPQPGARVVPYETTSGAWNWVLPETGMGMGDPFLCPYGLRGDTLWIREGLVEIDGAWHYAADKAPITMASDDPRYPAMLSWAHHNERESCPSRYMPRWASRITLEVTAVRVEPLRTISDADARAEGLDLAETGRAPERFHKAWNDINGKRDGCSWESNPWVWVVSFNRVEVANG